ncbi:beta-amyrin 16-alpha-hydroxylase CYP87D16-like [Cornus florida]|uniref:beta-amyrin 16-alpha-hydroxylase CYP87D16-like n=1 Tax=Cornus florida TaxID=4283 RepID=UPI00289E81C1|nr:beta-amyrin 16-alpha-hydroxylase CYP87D16-like [Cornus florida]
MWSVGLLCVGAVLAIGITHWIYKWRNPKCNGVLPPGSMGIPLIGEAIQLIIPSHSLELPPFLKHRLKRYGSIFRTNVAGRPVIVTADPEFNYFLLQQHGKLVESWSLDTFAKVFAQDSRIDRAHVQKYVRSLVLNHFGAGSIREKLLPQFHEVVRETLCAWSRQDSLEMKSAAAKMTLDFGAKQLFSYDPEEWPEKLSDLFKNFEQGLMSLPLNIPGTAHHRCLMNHKKVSNMMRDELRRRLASTDKRHQEDLLDHFIRDMNTEQFLAEDFIVQHMFGFLFIIFDSVSTSIALAIKLLAEHPLVLEELTAEHEAILKNRENPDSPITWEEYKSMTFTLQVINETLRLANIAPGMFRKAIKEINVKGYTIPEGWVIMLATSAQHLNSDKFENPLEFKPSRWKNLESSVIAKNFMPFGSGLKQCAGSEYSRVIIATLLHVLVTKYSWTKINGCEIMRSPIIRFPNGFHFKVSEKIN